MPFYRRKPTTIEAWPWNGELEMRGVCNGQCGLNRVPHVHTAHDIPNSAYGQLVFLSRGDWIVPEAKEGRYYPIKPHVFAATYEPVESST